MQSKEAYWDSLFKGYEGSGLSQEDFCSELGIPIAKFKYQGAIHPIASSVNRTYVCLSSSLSSHPDS